MFGGGTPRPLATIPAARLEDPAVQQAAAEALRRRQRARGFRSTILSQQLLSPQTPRGQETLGS